MKVVQCPHVVRSRMEKSKLAIWDQCTQTDIPRYALFFHLLYSFIFLFCRVISRLLLLVDTAHEKEKRFKRRKLKEIEKEYSWNNNRGHSSSINLLLRKAKSCLHIIGIINVFIYLFIVVEESLEKNKKCWNNKIK